jgi:peroxiredoxin-like protein
MEIAHHYQVNVNWNSDRKGTMSSPVLNATIEVATPPEFPKGMPGIWSPEHLLVAAVNSCLMTTFLAIAENFKFGFIHFESNADGTLEKVDGKYMIKEVALSPVLTIAPDADKEKALRILEKSEAACLISNSVKAKIILNPQIKIAEMVPAD